MKKRLFSHNKFLFVLLVVFSIQFIYICKDLNAQTTIQWQRTFGGSGSDLPSSIEQTSDGGYVVGGYSLSGISGDKTDSSMGSSDCWIVKLDSLGSIQWQKTIGGSGSDGASVQQTSDGGYIIGGYSNSNISGHKTEDSKGDNDYWILKLNSLGEIQWQKTIGGSDSDLLMTTQQTIDGGYILGGRSRSDSTGDKTENSRGSYDYWVLKLDTSGIIQWQKTIGGSKGDYLQALKQTMDGGYILSGYSSSDSTADKTENSYGGNADYWVVKINSSGEIQWQNTIGGDSFDILLDVLQTSDGGYFLGGYSMSGISGEKTDSSKGFYDYWLVKLDSLGTIQWQKSIGGSGWDYLYSSQQTSDGGYILGGYSDSDISGDKTDSSRGDVDYWIVKIDSAGMIQWQKTIGGDAMDILNSIQQTSDGAYALSGYSYSGISGDKTDSSRGGADFWVVKLKLWDVDTTYISQSICAGDSALIFGVYQATPGTYYDSLPNVGVNGCDSVTVIALTINDTTSSTINLMVCGSYTVPSGDETYTISGVYMDTIPNIAGCDSIMTITVDIDTSTIIAPDIPTLTASLVNICFGDNVTISVSASDSLNDASVWMWYTDSCGGTFVDTGSAITIFASSTMIYYVRGEGGCTIPGNCDSIILNPESYLTNVFDTICSNDSILLGGTYQDTAGVYYDTLQSVNSCDSVIITTLTVNSIYTTLVMTTICLNDSILLGGTYQDTAGVYYDTLTSVNYCDSIIITTLTINSVYTIYVSDTICSNESILLGGTYQDTAGIYYDTLPSVNNCDTVIITTLTINPTYTTYLANTICSNDSIFLGGNYQDTSGIYYDTLSSVNNCDSIIVTTLTVNPTYLTPAIAEICMGDSIFLGGSFQNVPKVYYDTLSSINNCDSIIATTLIVNPKPEIPIITESNGVLTSSSSDGNQWYLNGSIIIDSTSQNFTPTENGSYSVEVTDSNNCFSVSLLFDVTFVGIIENNFGDQLTAYPNPTSGHLSITLGSYYEDINVMVKNIAGQIISTYHIGPADKFDIEIVGVTGYYLVNIETSSGKLATIKVLKE